MLDKLVYKLEQIEAYFTYQEKVYPIYMAYTDKLACHTEEQYT